MKKGAKNYFQALCMLQLCQLVKEHPHLSAHATLPSWSSKDQGISI